MNRIESIRTNLLFSILLLAASNAVGDGSQNVYSEILEPLPLLHHISSGNVKLCLNEDDGDCDYLMNYAGQPNASLKLSLPLVGSFTTNYYVDEFLYPGMGEAYIEGNDTGVWVKADHASGQWSQMVTPVDGRTFASFVSKQYFIDPETSEIGTKFTWSIPREDAVFSVRGQTSILQFKNRSDISWHIRLRVRYSPVTDLDGDLATTDDRIYWQTDESFTPIFYEAMLEMTTNDPGMIHSDWRSESYLPHLYLERKAEVIPPVEPAEPLSDEMVAVLSIITSMILF